MGNELRQLVEGYNGGGLSYADFRSAFVRLHTLADSDHAIESLFGLVESACSAYEHRFLSEPELRLELAQRVFDKGAVNIHNSLFDIVLNRSNVVEVLSVASNAYADPFGFVGSQNIFDEDAPSVELEKIPA